MKTDELTNLAGLARRLNLPSKWLRERADAGEIPNIRIGKARRYNVTAVREALAKRAGTPKLLGLKAMAEHLDVSLSWLLVEAIEGRIPHVHAGGDKILFSVDAVETVLAERASREGLKADTGVPRE